MPYIEQSRPQRNYRPSPTVGINHRSIQAKNLFAWFPLSTYGTYDYVRCKNGSFVSSGAMPVRRQAKGGDWSVAFNQSVPNGLNIDGTLATYCTSTAKMFTGWAISDGGFGLNFPNGYSSPNIIGDQTPGGAYCALTMTGNTPTFNWTSYNYDSAERKVTDPSTVVFGRPYFLALVHYGGTLYLAVNGKVVNSVASTATASMTNSMRIGMSESPASLFGSIWDVRVYKPVPSYWRDLLLEMYDPATRYELYRNIGQRTYFDTGAPVGRQPPFNTRAAALGDRVAMGWRIHD